MNHETLESIARRKKPFTVDYTGFGWIMIANGVFEHEDLKYPWFAPKMQVFESGSVQDMCGEDVSFCLDAKEAGSSRSGATHAFVSDMKRIALFDVIQSILWRKTLTKEYFS